MGARKSAVGVVGLLLLAALVLQAGCAVAPTQQADAIQQTETTNDVTPGTITVTGSGEVSVSPDQAVVVLGVQTQAEEASTALAQNNEQMQAVIDALVQAGIPEKDIQTQLFSLQPRYSQAQQGSIQEVIGFTAIDLVSVQISDVKMVGDVIDAASQAGANRIDSIQFEVSNPTQQLDQARSAAWDDAQRKAEQLANLAGTELGSVLSINEVSSTPRIVEAAVVGLGGGAAPIQPGQQSFTVQLQVEWALP
jgi:uncharacterized protein YggE